MTGGSSTALLLGLGVTAGLVLLVLIAAPAPPGPSAGGSVPVRGVTTGGRRRGRAAPAGPLDIARLVERLASITAAGVPLRQAWGAVADASPPGPLRELARTVGAGGDPRRTAAPALARRGEIRALGAALVLCERTGAPIVPMLRTLALALRDVADADLARRSAFAGPRSTARILSVLPLAGVGLGLLLGADPIAMLLGTAAGRVLLAVGVVLTVAGWWWMHRLLTDAAGPRATAVDPSIVLDLMTGPLAAGAPLGQALVAVADALDGDEPSALLDRAGRSLSAGAPARTSLEDPGEGLAVLRDAALIAEATGADITSLLRAAAEDARRGRARLAEAAEARLAVRLVLPTGLALLPAFVALGIVPTAASLLGGSLAQVMPR